MKTYLVGGAVRDQLLGRECVDRDYVVVGATPEQLLAQGYKQVGADFPVFLHPETGEEYALARIERKTGEGYLGFSVDASTSVTLKDDLSRRDLTINSMAMDLETGEIIDYFGGREDLANKVLRVTSPAFREDPLRVVRLARFQARYHTFTIHPDTIAMATEMVHAGELNHLPHERFAAEIEKLLTEPDDTGCRTYFFDVLREVGAQDYVNFFAPVSLTRCGAVMGVMNLVPREDRMLAFTVLAVQSVHAGSRRLIMAGAQAPRIFEVLDSIKRYSADQDRAEFLLDVLTRSGAWSERTDFKWLVKLMDVSLLVGERYPIHPTELVLAHCITEPVSRQLAAALVAEGLTGAEIGKAIKAERLRRLKILIIPT